MIEIDGSMGEGGGQILRSALGLAMVTGRPFAIHKIRAGRKKPGLMRQHLTCVEAAMAVCSARAEGAQIGATEVSFHPGPVRHGDYSFSVGTAGSCALVLQTILPALMTAGGPSSVTLEGGTHNPFAPPFDFLQRTFLPALAAMGPKVSATLEAPGFYPAGGGRMVVSIRPAPFAPLELGGRGGILSVTGEAVVCNLSDKIAREEAAAMAHILAIPREAIAIKTITNARGQGNVIMAFIQSQALTETITAFGQRGVRARVVGATAAREAEEYISSGAPVGFHLADQLLIPMALGGGGSFITQAPTNHTLTNMEVIAMFLGARITVAPEGGKSFKVSVPPRTL